MDRRRLLTGVAGAFVAQYASAQTTPAPPQAPAPFTVESVVAQQKTAFPDVRAPDLPAPGLISAQQDVVYQKRGDEALKLDIYRPIRSALVPAALIIHGGGWDSGSRQMERAFAKHLAAQGFAAIPVSYRLGKPGRFPDNIYDLKAAVRWVRTHAKSLGIDERFIAIIGGSAGGHLAAFVGSSNGISAFDDGPGDSHVDAVVDIDGAASFPDAALITQEENRSGATSRYLGGNYSARRETWFAASPLSYVSQQSAPTFFINSNRPTPILPGRPEMSARLKALGIASDIFDMPPGTPHPFWLVEPWFTPTLERSAAWLTAQYRAKIAA